MVSGQTGDPLEEWPIPLRYQLSSPPTIMTVAPQEYPVLVRLRLICNDRYIGNGPCTLRPHAQPIKYGNRLKLKGDLKMEGYLF